MEVFKPTKLSRTTGNAMSSAANIRNGSNSGIVEALSNYDKHTEQFTMIDTPFGGPRRFRADSQGNLWIPAFTDGRIYKYEPDADRFTGYDLPTGASDSVYAVAVDPIDDTVWGCGSNSDTMLHFDPKSEEFTTYRFPSLVTFCREISFDQEGNVWTSYSNVPSSSIEGGATAIVKLSVQR
jgi:virginiamycin B lyase